MDFKLTEERQMLQDSLRRFLSEATGFEQIAEATQRPEGFDPALWQKLTEMGLPGAMFTEAQGGFGGAGFDIMVVAEELGRAGLPTPLIDSAVLSGTVLAATRPEMAEELCAGRIIAFAHAEPGARYDLPHVETTAQRSAEGWRITGQKAVIYSAPAADACIISARTSGAANAKSGISLFLAPVSDIEMRDYPLQGGGRAADLTLDLTVPQEALLGDEGAGFALIEAADTRALAAQCAEALGLMERIKALTIDYLQQRRQFGQPIGRFQALQHRMADMLIEIEQTRSAVINLCGHLGTPDAALHASAAKNLVARTARLVVEESIQMHGGIGMTMEYALGHFAKRLSMVEHRFGDADYHLERFIHLAQDTAGAA